MGMRGVSGGAGWRRDCGRDARGSESVFDDHSEAAAALQDLGGQQGDRARVERREGKFLVNHARLEEVAADQRESARVRDVDDASVHQRAALLVPSYRRDGAEIFGQRPAPPAPSEVHCEARQMHCAGPCELPDLRQTIGVASGNHSKSTPVSGGLMRLSGLLAAGSASLARDSFASATAAVAGSDDLADSLAWWSADYLALVGSTRSPVPELVPHAEACDEAERDQRKPEREGLPHVKAEGVTSHARSKSLV